MRPSLLLILAFIAFHLDMTHAQAQSRDTLPSEGISAAVAFDVTSCIGGLDLSACDDLIAQVKGQGRPTAKAYAARAQARAILDDLPGAQSDIAKAVTLDPQNEILLHVQAEVARIASDPQHDLVFACNLGTDLSKRLDACTQLVAVPRLSPEQRWNYYVDRARAYFAAGNFVAASADVDKALQGNPRNIKYIKAKISITVGSGDYQAALTQTNDALAKLPKPTLDLSLLKGQLAYLMGHHTMAIEEILASMRVDSKDAGPVYWFTILRTEDHEDATNDLLRFNEELDARDYYVKIARFLLGKMTSQALISAAHDGPPLSSQRRLCEGYFTIGHQAWLVGDLAAARTAFKDALQTNQYDMIEYHAAKMLLGKISGS
jgi:lipoprotein NlpI